MGDISGGDIESIDIQGNTAYVTTFLMDGNGSVTIDYTITQTQPGVITVTEKWNKTPEYGYTATYYQISEEEFSNL